MTRNAWRPHIESALSLDIWRMHALGCLRQGRRGSWLWTIEGEQAPSSSVGYSVEIDGDRGSLLLTYSHDGSSGKRESAICKIFLSSIPLNFGGCRWYGHCPYTGRRARKLYKFSGIEHFCHRTAVRPTPTYASQRVSGWHRINDQRWLLRRRMGDKWSDLFSEPQKPKWMRWRTFERFAAIDARLAEREVQSLPRFLVQLLDS